VVGYHKKSPFGGGGGGGGGVLFVCLGVMERTIFQGKKCVSAIDWFSSS
jgi:hypothetical protein